MEKIQTHFPAFKRLKIAKKRQPNKNIFTLEFEIPASLQEMYRFEAGQYLRLRFEDGTKVFEKDYSLLHAPHEGRIEVAIKMKADDTSAAVLFKNYAEGDFVEVSPPKGRFTLLSRPNERRTIICFASGIGITPIFSHIKNILHKEPLSRIYLFYGNSDEENTLFKAELDELVQTSAGRLEVHYFFTRQTARNALFQGRLDAKKTELIINQILGYDEDDEEAVIWDQTDELLICGPGEMIREIANAAFNNGIRKKNIHFELFESFNEDVFPVTQQFPLLKNIKVSYTYLNRHVVAALPDNSRKILHQLLELGYDVPYSCKSGICGACQCKLESGAVEMTDNEYLTDKELSRKLILACTSIALSPEIKLNFDVI